MADNNILDNIDFTNLITSMKQIFEEKSNKTSVMTDTAQADEDKKYLSIAGFRSWITTKLSAKQDTLVGSGTGQNIKTINNESLLGSGNISITVEGGDYAELNNKPQINSVTLTGNKTLASLGIQGTISDLSDIRAGAELGETALQDGDNVSKLTNDAGYLTEHQSLSNYYTKGQTDSAIGSATSDMATKTYVDGELADKQDTISDLSTIRTNAGLGATALQPSALNDYYNKTQTDGKIADAISGVTQFDYQVVQTLPSSGVKGTIYLVPKTDTAQQDIYNEYLWLSDKWEKIGTTAIDLSNYYTKSETYTQSEVNTQISNHNSSSSAHSSLFSAKQDTISDLSTIRSGASLGATAVQPSAMATALQDFADELADALLDE